MVLGAEQFVDREVDEMGAEGARVPGGAGGEGNTGGERTAGAWTIDGGWK